ncbi:TetR/AcrR family transcriptional regulator [Phenylobacterium aquaticum]|uniref:TetR/AcrR family transcriptional regulator n=1 Tax=Phenylobacterium aquaticum TaxID=1763816 RepID=UPI001F5DBC3E|nr:TetR/AcrR family transcriptional regulator [Phenylobacterium aquaticum]MCI3132485.1 TetR family transcriptional regulator [Phenylobacterium aquaticum]
MDTPSPTAAEKRSRRPRNPEATRAAILDAARRLFGRSGYDQVSLREIAAEAEADVALVKRYFGGKEGLFTEALKTSFQADRLAGWDRSRFAQDMAALMAGDPHGPETRTESFQFLLSAAVSPTTAPLARIALQDRFIDPIRAWIGGEQAEARSRLLTAVIVGLLVERLVRGEALQGRPREAFMAEVEQMIAAVLGEPV